MSRAKVALVAAILLIGGNCGREVLALAPVKLSGPLVAGGDVASVGFRFSPDSSRVLYVADQDTDFKDELYIVASGGGTPIKLNGPLIGTGLSGGDVGWAIFNPDGSRVVYYADQASDEVFEIYTVPSIGGTAVKLNGPLVANGDASSVGLQFSADGSRVVYGADQTTDDVFEIYSVPSIGGTAVKLNGPLVAGGDIFLANQNSVQFSPDGSRVLYLADQDTNDVSEIYSVPSIGGTSVKLNGPIVAGGRVLPGDLDFSPDGSRILYHADQDSDEVFEIYSVPSAGGASVKLNGPLVAGGDVTAFGFEGAARFSPDGSRVLYHADQETNDVSELYIVVSTGGAPKKLNGTLVAGGDVNPFLSTAGIQFSPDGSRVLYQADQDVNDVNEIYVVASTGGLPVKLNGPLVSGGDVSANGLQFSPDGSRVLYLADQATDNVIEAYTVPVSGGTAVKINGTLVAGGAVSALGLQFSPDSSRVLYLADQDSDNVDEIYIVPSGGGVPTKVNAPLVAGGDVTSSSLQFSNPQFSPDGSRVVYRADQDMDEVFEIYTRLVRLQAQASGDWENGAVWDQGVVPDQTMQIIVDGSVDVLASGNDIVRTANELRVGGGAGTSILTLQDGAILTPVNGFLIDPGGIIRGDGVVSAKLNEPNQGEIRAGGGDQLHFTSDSFANAGQIDILGATENLAEIEFDGTVENMNSTGLIIGQHAVIRFNEGLINQGAVALSFGATNIFGDVENSGSIVVSGGAVGTFYDDVEQNGALQVSQIGNTTSVAVFFGAVTGTGGSTGGGDIFFEGDLRPGNSAATVIFNNDVAFGAAATLEIELGGTNSGAEYDQVHVLRNLVLDGTLAVTLINGFSPEFGDSFDVLDWTNLSGTFDTLLLPVLSGGLLWNTSQLYTTGVLSVVAPGVPGDYNDDGGVDAADYVMWRKLNGTSTVMPNDPNPLPIDGDQYATWRGNFGETGSGRGSADVVSGSDGVPEPSVLVLLLAAVIGGLACGHGGIPHHEAFIRRRAIDRRSGQDWL